MTLIHRILQPVVLNNQVPKRSFFYWLSIIFNRVDTDKIKDVGPNQACAEWLISNGASVKWKCAHVYTSNYDDIIKERSGHAIEAVDATDSGISHVGFPYFEGCKHIKELKLVHCEYIDDRAIPLLSLLKDSLNTLEILRCPFVTAEGLESLKDLKNLRSLKITGEPYIKNTENIKTMLSKDLPDCTIEFQNTK